MNKKIIGLISAVLVFVVAGSASAACSINTLNECDQQGLLTIIASLLSQQGQQTPATSSQVPAACVGITFNRTLAVGSTGADVKCLQALLNTDPATKLAESGAGSPGYETEYFGAVTEAAVKKFQAKYASEVLAPLGLTEPTGIFGAKSIAKANAILASMASAPTTPTTPKQPSEITNATECVAAGYFWVAPGVCNSGAAQKEASEITSATECVAAGYFWGAQGCYEEGEEGEEEEEEEAEEGYIAATLYGIPANTTLYLGSQNNSVYAFSVKAYDSDARVKRVTLNFDKRPWLYFNTISLYAGDELVKEVEATSSAFEQVTAGSSYNLNITGLDVLIPENTSKLFTVKVSLPSATTQAPNSTISVKLAADGVRAVDEAGLQQYAPATALGARTITVAGSATGALEISLAPDSPAEGVAIISDVATTSDVELARVNLKAKYNAVNVSGLTFTGEGLCAGVDCDDADLATILPLVKLYDSNGNVLATATPADHTSTSGEETADIVFSLETPLAIAKDSTVTLVVKADVAKIGITSAGDYAYVALADTGVTAEDANYNTLDNTAGSDEILGSATGKHIHFYTAAPVLTLVEATAVSVAAGDASGTEANFTIKMNITANGGDIYIPNGPTKVVADKIDSAKSGLISFTLSSTGDPVAFYGWMIPINQTRTLTISGHIAETTGAAGMNGAYLDLFTWKVGAAGTEQEWGTSSDDSLKNKMLSISNIFKTNTVYISGN